MFVIQIAFLYIENYRKGFFYEKIIIDDVDKAIKYIVEIFIDYTISCMYYITDAAFM